MQAQLKKSYIQLHLAIVLAGFTGVFGKLVSLNETLLVFWRVLFASLMLVGLLKFLRKKKGPIILSKKVGFMLANGALLALHWVFFFGSIKASTVSLGVLCFCLTSFFTAVLEPLMNKKRFSLKELALSSLSLLGISFIFGFDSAYRWGIFLGIISSILVSFFTIFNERLVKQHDTFTVTTFQMVGGTLGLSVIIMGRMLWGSFSFSMPQGMDVWYLLILSLVCTVCMYILINNALRHINSFTVNLSFNLEPVYGIFLSFLIFNEAEDFSGSFWIGVSIIVLSLVLQTVFAKPIRKRAKKVG